MKFLFSNLLTLVTITSVGSAAGFKHTRLDKNNAALLIVDHQIGLSEIVRDYSAAEFRQSIIAHAELGKVFNLPTVLTTSAYTGPNGNLPNEIVEMWADAPTIHRNGEVNAWDNADFRKAVEATGKKQIILAGITTDVCTAFLALSLVEAGYEVFANTDASGTFNDKIAADANRRMENAGVTLMGMFAIAMDLMRDWRNTPGAAELLPFLDKYLVSYSLVARAHGGAVRYGAVLPGQMEILDSDAVTIPPQWKEEDLSKTTSTHLEL